MSKENSHRRRGNNHQEKIENSFRQIETKHFRKSAGIVDRFSAAAEQKSDSGNYRYEKNEFGWSETFGIGDSAALRTKPKLGPSRRLSAEHRTSISAASRRKRFRDVRDVQRDVERERLIDDDDNDNICDDDESGNDASGSRRRSLAWIDGCRTESCDRASRERDSNLGHVFARGFDREGDPSFWHFNARKGRGGRSC